MGLFNIEYPDRGIWGEKETKLLLATNSLGPEELASLSLHYFNETVKAWVPVAGGKPIFSMAYNLPGLPELIAKTMGVSPGDLATAKLSVDSLNSRLIREIWLEAPSASNWELAVRDMTGAIKPSIMGEKTPIHINQTPRFFFDQATKSLIEYPTTK